MYFPGSWHLGKSARLWYLKLTYRPFENLGPQIFSDRLREAIHPSLRRGCLAKRAWRLLYFIHSLESAHALLIRSSVDSFHQLLGRHTSTSADQLWCALPMPFKAPYHITVIYPPLNVIWVIPEEDVYYNCKFSFPSPQSSTFTRWLLGYCSLIGASRVHWGQTALNPVKFGHVLVLLRFSSRLDV